MNKRAVALTALISAVVLVALGIAAAVFLIGLRTSDGPVLVMRPKNGRVNATEDWLLAPKPGDPMTDPGSSGTMVGAGGHRWLRKDMLRQAKVTCDGRGDVVGLTLYNDADAEERITAELSDTATSWLYYDAQGKTNQTKPSSVGDRLRKLPTEFLTLVNYASCRFAADPGVSVPVTSEIGMEFYAP